MSRYKSIKMYADTWQRLEKERQQAQEILRQATKNNKVVVKLNRFIDFVSNKPIFYYGNEELSNFFIKKKKPGVITC